MKRTITLLSMLFCTFVINGLGTVALAQTTPEIAKGNCAACQTDLEKTLRYCTDKRGKYAEAQFTNIIKDAITACKMTEEFMTRGSSYQNKAAEICVEACTQCAKACDSFKDDDRLKACANECRKTAGNCSKVALK